MDGHGISLSRTVSNKALLHPCVPWCALLSLTCYGTPFCSPKMSEICQDFPCLAKCCLAFFGGDAKSLAWVFLARRVLPFVLFFFWRFLGAAMLTFIIPSASGPPLSLRVGCVRKEVFGSQNSIRLGLDTSTMRGCSCIAQDDPATLEWPAENANNNNNNKIVWFACRKLQINHCEHYDHWQLWNWI